MDDLQLMTSEGTARSLIMLDEIGRGTSTAEGAALSAALLEWLDARGVGAVFATHLHEIEDALLRLPRGALPSLRRCCLPVAAAADGRMVMSFTLQDGVCRSSLALHVARRAGLPTELIERAEQLLAEAEGEAEGGSAEPATGGGDDGRRRGGGLGDDDEGEGATDEEQLKAAGEVLRSLSGSAELVHVGADWQPPPRLSGRSCVYLLQLGRGAPPHGSGGPSPGPPSLYVGESDSIGRRLQQHRRKHSERRLECVLVEVPSKSAALAIEAETIRKLKAMGLGRVRNVVHA